MLNFINYRASTALAAEAFVPPSRRVLELNVSLLVYCKPLPASVRIRFLSPKSQPEMPSKRRSRQIQPALDRELVKRRKIREQQPRSQISAPVLTELQVRDVMALPRNPSTGRPATPPPTGPPLRPTVSLHQMEQLQLEIVRDSAALLAIPPLTRDAISTC
jgi:hypothetical protein